MKNETKKIMPLMVLLFASSSFAADVPPLHDISQINNSDIIRSRSVSPETVMGEQFDLRRGSVAFRQVDLTLSGNGPSIEVSRKFDLNRNLFGNGATWNGAFDWLLEVPRLSTMALSQRGNNAWPISEMHELWRVNSSNPLKRCSEFTEPLHVPSRNLAQPFLPKYWWSGVMLEIPGSLSEPVLAVTPDSVLSAKTTQKLSTSSGWVLSCLPGTKNGVAGEAFVATSPDGVKYWFDWFAQGYSDSAQEVNGQIVEYGEVMSTAITQALLYATKVQDRFGNYVEYKYQGRNLIEISSSDGRKVSVKWRTDVPYLIDSIEYPANGAVARIAYSYHPNGAYLNTLSKVSYPDGSSMDLDLRSIFNICKIPAPYIPGEPQYSYWQCPEAGGLGSFMATMRAPSGLIGEYEVKVSPYHRPGMECIPNDSGRPGGGVYYAMDPCNLTVFNLVRKKYSGPGLAPAQWTYRYITEKIASSPSDWRYDWTFVNNPDGTYTASKFASYGISSALDGRLLSLYEGATISNDKVTGFMRSTSHEYHVGGKFGTSPAQFVNRASDESPVVISSTTIAERGMTFARKVTSFDSLSRPLITVKSSQPAN